jgi:hypothetical protein
MGEQATAISKLENVPSYKKHAPSLSILRKYAAALGKRVEPDLI